MPELENLLGETVEATESALNQQLHGDPCDTEGWDDITNSLIAKNLTSTTGTLKYDYFQNSIKMEPSGDILNADDRLLFNFQKLHKIKENGEFRLHIHWEQTTTDNIVWEIRYRKQNNGEEKTLAWTSVTANSDTDSVFPYTSGTLNQITRLCVVDLSDVSISGTVQFRLARTDASPVDVQAVFVDAHYNTDQERGSRQEFVK